jgi:hypothetical protein
MLLIRLCKFVLAMTLFAGLYARSTQPVFAQAGSSGIAQRVSTLETRVDTHDAQIAELHLQLTTLAAQTAASLKYIGGAASDIPMEPAPTVLSDGRSQYLSDVIVSLQVPASASRTHLLVVAGAQYEWHQAISPQNYSAATAVIVELKSTAFTNAGLSFDTIGGALGTERQVDDAASTVGVMRFRDPIWTFAWDISTIANVLNGNFGPRATINGQPITDAQALNIATSMMHSAVDVRVRARARTKSVDHFVGLQGTLQIWGDGN